MVGEGVGSSLSGIVPPVPYFPRGDLSPTHSLILHTDGTIAGCTLDDEPDGVPRA